MLSSLDALAGFTQLELAEEDREKTAFRTHLGLYQFKRMPFRLRNGPSIFQRTMQTILAPFLWLFCLVYIDDIVVFSKSYEEHITHLDKVLRAIEEAGITLSPNKCHLFYPSVLLLGHKVSRLGLSTHEEKVKAIVELAPPTKTSQLQHFLGMAVYFSAFIPHYSSMASPLFALLKKGARWKWGEVEQYAFDQIKKALEEAPVLGHPVQGSPYRLYTNASDVALGCALQQVQLMRAGDLKETKAYDRIAKARELGKDVPDLLVKLPTETKEEKASLPWANSLDDTMVRAERVIGYWSRTFKPAERNYSTTEREALAAKEGLVRFQPFIEGEAVTLVTDHSALQWASTYENANRRLASWGAIFSAFKPGLQICHRPGRVHSNVDPLSRLPRDRDTGLVRMNPEHFSPSKDKTTAINPDEKTLSTELPIFDREPKEAFVSCQSDEGILKFPSVFAVTRAAAKGKAAKREDTPEALTKKVRTRGETRKRKSGKVQGPLTQEGNPPELKEEPAEDEPLSAWDRQEKWKNENDPPPILIHMEESKVREFVEGYKNDFTLSGRWEDARSDPDAWYAGRRYFKDERGLLFFKDADFKARLCVPNSLKNSIIKEAHESPFETAHAGPEKLYARLSNVFYWHRMQKDIKKFCISCDVCQKTKFSNFSRFGRLLPNPIPARPYETVSMDIVTGFPMSNGFNAIWVAVDRLTKHAQFVPITTGLSVADFAKLFVDKVICRYGVPESIISDRDPRWTHDFWREVAKHLRTDMWLSSSHHPQHDGQTEVVNRFLETMLRGYASEDREKWSEWIPLLEHAYNSMPSATTGFSPFFLLYGYQPRDTFGNVEEGYVGRRIGKDRLDSATFLKEIESWRTQARDAIARAQDKQARAYNKGRRMLEFKSGDLVLVSPHSLEWKESKGEFAKLAPRYIGPFEVMERMGENTYQLRMDDRYPGSHIVNIEHLRKYEASPEDLGERTKLPETRKEKDPAEEYEVEKIVAHRYNRATGAVEFLLRWHGYSPLYDSWATLRDLANAPNILREYRHKEGI